MDSILEYAGMKNVARNPATTSTATTATRMPFRFMAALYATVHIVLFWQGTPCPYLDLTLVYSGKARLAPTLIVTLVRSGKARLAPTSI